MDDAPPPAEFHGSAPEANPNHHLWRNHGNWFINYTIHPSSLSKERIRHSLKTKCVETARERRDLILRRVATEGVLARSPRTGRILWSEEEPHRQMPGGSTLPQVKTPAGNIALAIPPGELIAFLDRLLGESTGRKPPQSAPRAPRRLDHPDHHLWNNNGSWWVTYTIYPTPATKERLRQSLNTRCVETARLRRDEILAACAAKGILAGSGRVEGA